MRHRSPELVTQATQHVRTRAETVNAHASAKYPMMIRARIRGVREPQQGSPAAADGATFQRTSLRESQPTGPTVSRHARRDIVPDHAAQEMRAGGVGENASLLLAALGETFSMACCPHHASGVLP